MAEEISEYADFKEVEKAFNDFNREFAEFKKTFNSQLDILKHSNILKDEDKLLSGALKHISQTIVVIELGCIVPKKEMQSKNALALVPKINKLIKWHQGMISDVNMIKKNLPILQTIKLYLHNAITLLGNLCTAVANFLTITAPQKAKDAKAAMVTSFTNLKKNNAKENNGYEDFGLQHEQDSPTPPSLPRH